MHCTVPSIASIPVESPLPDTPEGFASQATPDTATLTWRAPATPIDGYILTLGTVTYPRQFTETLGSGDTTFTFRDIEPDTIYQAELQTFKWCGKITACHNQSENRLVSDLEEFSLHLIPYRLQAVKGNQGGGGLNH